VDGNNGRTYAADTRVPVTLMGFLENEKYYFINRTGITLRGGDLVYVDTIGDNLNSGIITNIYKYYNELYII
jgi:hypothetical protein